MSILSYLMFFMQKMKHLESLINFLPTITQVQPAVTVEAVTHREAVPSQVEGSDDKMRVVEVMPAAVPIITPQQGNG